MAKQMDPDAVTDPGPGVHVVVHPSPAGAARTVAQRLGAGVVDSPALAEAVVAQRSSLPAARARQARAEQIADLARSVGEETDGQAEADAALLARRAELIRLGRRQTLDDAQADALRSLADELSRLEALRADTERRLHDRFAQVLGTPTGTTLAVHPSSLRTSAGAVVAEQAAVNDARQALALLPLADSISEPPEPAARPRGKARRTPLRIDAAQAGGTGDLATGEPGVEHLSPSGQEEPVDSSAGSVLIPLGVIVLGLFGACLSLVAGLPGPFAVLPVLLAVLAAAAIRRRLRAERTDADDRAAASASLAQATDSVDVTSTGQRGEGSERADDGHAWSTERELRTQRVTDAEERLRAAEQAWGSLAGPDADPHAVEALIRWRDPQHDATADLVAVAPAARAVAALHRRTRAEWRVAWGLLGRQAPPPEPTLVELVLADLRETAPDPSEAIVALEAVPAAEQRHARRSELAALVEARDADGQGADAPGEDDLANGPVVLLEPFAGLGAQRRIELRRRLEELPPDVQVIVVVGSADDVPAIEEA